jgi:hypothetical protein
MRLFSSSPGKWNYRAVRGKGTRAGFNCWPLRREHFQLSLIIHGEAESECAVQEICSGTVRFSCRGVVARFQSQWRLAATKSMFDGRSGEAKREINEFVSSLISRLLSLAFL